MDQKAVERWLAGFVEGLRERFGERLVFVGHHGSWARGEARAESDIDVFVIVDRIKDEDLQVYRDLVYARSGEWAVSSFLGSVEELKSWPRYERIQCWYGMKVLHGGLAGLVVKPGEREFREDIRVKAATNLHVARHYLLHPHDLTKAVERLYYPFKECYYAMQSWMLLTTGNYYGRKVDMMVVLSEADDREVVRIAKDWHELAEARRERPEEFVGLLERWCRRMLGRIGDVERRA